MCAPLALTLRTSATMASMPALNLDAMQESDDEDARDTSAMMNMLLKIKVVYAV